MSAIPLSSSALVGREFAFTSHQRAIAATDAGRFANEIVPLGGLGHDEGVRRDTSLEKMATLEPLTPGGRITAAVASQISDASSAVLIASERAVKEHGLTPRARIHHISVRGADPIMMLTAPIPATKYALERTGLTIDDIDLFEVNEAFASVVLAWLQETGVPVDATVCRPCVRVAGSRMSRSSSGCNARRL